MVKNLLDTKLKILKFVVSKFKSLRIYFTPFKLKDILDTKFKSSKDSKTIILVMKPNRYTFFKVEIRTLR